MLTVDVADQPAALRSLVFTAIDRWNAAHPHPLRSHREHGSVNITQVYADASGVPSYTITIVCALAGAGQLAFHGHDLGAVAEHAKLTLEHRIDAELGRRADKAREAGFDGKYGIAV